MCSCVTRNLWSYEQLIYMSIRVIYKFIIVLIWSLLCEMWWRLESKTVVSSCSSQWAVMIGSKLTSEQLRRMLSVLPQRFAVRLTLNKIHNTWRGFCDCECAITKHAILRELYPQMCLGINFNKRVRDIYSILYRILYCVLCSILYLNTILHTIHHTKLHTVLCSILYYILYCTIHYVLYCILYCTLSCSRLHGST